MTSNVRVLLLVGLAAGCSTPPTDPPPHDGGSRIDAAASVDGGLDAAAAPDVGPTSDAFVPLSDAGCASTPTYDDVNTAILSVSCSGPINCHGSSSHIHGGGLVLGDPTSYDALVGFPSNADPTILRVVPGDAATSLLYRKLIDDLPADGSLGAPMPNGEGIAWHELPPDQIELVRCWIAGGATR